MKILTLWQPWASLIAIGLKQYETRSWGTAYRGKLAIHAAKRPVKRDEVLPILYAIGGGGVSLEDCDKVEQLCNSDLPLGAIVAIADLTECNRMMPISGYAAPWEVRINQVSVLERSVGDWQAGRYAWKLENTIALPQPIYCLGGQGLRNLDSAIEQLINQQLVVQK